MGQRRGACRVLVGKPAGKGPLENPRRRWIFKKWDAGTWTLSLSLSLYIYIYIYIYMVQKGTCGRLL